MKQSKDPFEAAYEEQEESPPESPTPQDDLDPQIASTAPPSSDGAGAVGVGGGSGGGASSSQDVVGLANQDDDENFVRGSAPSSTPMASARNMGPKNNKDDDDEEEEDNMEVELSKFPSSADPVKMAKMQTILSQFTEDQMSRYESFRRSALQKSNMRRLLVSICGTQKISLPMTIVVCGIAKMFVGKHIVSFTYRYNGDDREERFWANQALPRKRILQKAEA
ncbi:hypothetical protein Tsubulata_002876, partial [Turnera subulata]